MSYSDTDEFGPEPAWMDGYTGGQEAKDDHFDAAPPLMPGGESASARLRRVEQERDQATRLLEYALHLRQHGERAPGGDEMWAEFDRRAEDFLRGLPIRPTPHLNAVIRERDEARAGLEQERDKSGRYAAAHRHACTMLAAAVQERDAARAKADQLYADLAEALDELEQAQAVTNDKEKST